MAGAVAWAAAAGAGVGAGAAAVVVVVVAHCCAQAGAAGALAVRVVDTFESLIIVLLEFYWLFLVNRLSLMQATCQPGPRNPKLAGKDRFYWGKSRNSTIGDKAVKPVPTPRGANHAPSGRLWCRAKG